MPNRFQRLIPELLQCRFPVQGVRRRFGRSLLLRFFPGLLGLTAAGGHAKLFHNIIAFIILWKTVKSTIRVLETLESLCKDPPAGVSELSQRLHVKPSSMHRFLSVLTQQGYVEKDLSSRKYGATLKVFHMGLTVRNRLDIIHVARPYLEELGRRFHETVNLALFIQERVLVIDRVESLETLKIDPGIGRLLLPHCTALGKVFLADLSEEALGRYLKRHVLTRFTKKTITLPHRLKTELMRVRRAGFSLDYREFDDGVCCLAAPVRDASGKVVAGISISGPTSRVSLKRLKSFKPFLINGAGAISEKLGYREREDGT